MNRKSICTVKRMFDLSFAILLIILLSPLFLLIAVIIKLESEGSIFYKHTRVGKNGKRFEMWKFRTMVVGADEIGPGLTKDGDPRITRIGKLLRRFSLDELPQIINVFRGEMSIVGPRPEIPEIVETYSLQQKQAISIRPGITGLSQINGRDELPLDEKLEFEIQYVENCSLLLDFKILLKTMPAIISGRGNRY